MSERATQHDSPGHISCSPVTALGPSRSTPGQRVTWLLGSVHYISGTKGILHGVTLGGKRRLEGERGQLLRQQGFIAADLAQCQNPDKWAVALGLT